MQRMVWGLHRRAYPNGRGVLALVGWTVGADEGRGWGRHSGEEEAQGGEILGTPYRGGQRTHSINNAGSHSLEHRGAGGEVKANCCRRDKLPAGGYGMANYSKLTDRRRQSPHTGRMVSGGGFRATCRPHGGSHREWKTSSRTSHTCACSGHFRVHVRASRAGAGGRG